MAKHKHENTNQLLLLTETNCLRRAACRLRHSSMSINRVVPSDSSNVAHELSCGPITGTQHQSSPRLPPRSCDAEKGNMKCEQPLTPHTTHKTRKKPISRTRDPRSAVFSPFMRTMIQSQPAESNGFGGNYVYGYFLQYIFI